MQLFLKILSGKANGVDPDQKQSDLGLHCLHIPFYWQLCVRNFRTFTINIFFYFSIKYICCEYSLDEC